MSDIVVYRFVNVFYYLLFLAYAIIFLIYIFPKRKEQPYKNALKIFLATSIVLTAMEFFGTFSGIRVFYIGGQLNIGYQLLLQLIMGIGEGGTMTSVMYLMVESVYEKNSKKYILYSFSLTMLMLTFASFTFLYKTI